MVILSASQRSSRSLGVIAVLVAALCSSSAGLLVRLVDQADGWQILFFRSLSFAATVFLFMVVTNRTRIAKRLLNIGPWGLVVAVCLGGASIAYIFSLLFTTVANVVFILSASPFLAALMAGGLLGERVSLRAWICMGAALTGVAVMLVDGVLAGTVAGSAIAFLAALGYAASVVAFRAGKDIDMMPATCLAGVFAATVSGFLLTDFAMSWHDLMIALLLGTVQIGLTYILITIAARHISAADVTLLMLLQVVASPVWVWIVFGEIPALPTLIGGCVVLGAVVIQAVEKSKAPG